MKKTLVLAGTILTALAFNGCNNEEALKQAQAQFDSKLTAVTDSLKGAAQAELDAVKATYDAQVQSLTDSLAAKTAALEAAVAKKTGTTTTKKVDPKTANMDAKEKASYEQKKSKMAGK